MADPTTINCPGACTVTVIHELSLPPLQLDAADGAAIASAILAVWAVGWSIRVLLQTLRSSDGNNSESDN